MLMAVGAKAGSEMRNDIEKITMAAVHAADSRDDTEKISIKELIETFVKILMKPRPPVFVEIPVPGWPT